jgi:hypothetical protein
VAPVGAYLGDPEESIGTSPRSSPLVRIFEPLKEDRGLPDIFSIDDPPEFLGSVFTKRSEANGIFIVGIKPGKPNQNASTDSVFRRRTRSSERPPSVGKSMMVGVSSRSLHFGPSSPADAFCSSRYRPVSRGFRKPHSKEPEPDTHGDTPASASKNQL